MRAKDDVQQAFCAVSKSLTDLEDAIRERWDTPTENIDLRRYAKIGFPHNYIRRKGHFIAKFHLNKLIGTNETLRDNIAYSLQLTDFHNYIINRFNFWGAIKNQFIKNAIAHNVAIVEAIVHEILFRLGKYCIVENGTCPYSQNCNGFINRSEHLKNTKAIVLLREKILADESFTEAFTKFKSIRDKIHVRISGSNEFFDRDNFFSIDNYNESILLLKYLRENILDDIEKFKIRRESLCIKWIDK